MSIAKLVKESESPVLDFKREFHENNAELLHDILCLSNSLAPEDRFLVFGIANDKTVVGVDSDRNRKTNADLHDFLRQVPLNKIPKVNLTFEELEGKEIGILQINHQNDKPYYLTKDFSTRGIVIRAGAIYTRLGDTNIPRSETAPEDHVEIMWKERFGLLASEPPDFESSFPISFGDSRETVHKVLGEPDATGWQIEQFYGEGIEISYDQHFDFVDAICIYPLSVGTAFAGTLCGIKLGDSFSDAKSILGTPAYLVPAYADGTLAVWEIEERLFVVEIWRAASRGSSIPVAQLGTIRSISYCERKSGVGYNAMVAAVISKIRRGLTPTEFERPDILSSSDVEDELFLEDYELLGTRQAIMGGQEVLVGFPESKRLIAFWIYPLEWRFPVVRAIYEYGDREQAESASN